jgi:hypothetical protein
MAVLARNCDLATVRKIAHKTKGKEDNTMMSHKVMVRVRKGTLFSSSLFLSLSLALALALILSFCHSLNHSHSITLSLSLSLNTCYRLNTFPLISLGTKRSALLPFSEIWLRLTPL